MTRNLRCYWIRLWVYWYCIIHELLLPHLAVQQSPIWLAQKPPSQNHTFLYVGSLTQPCQLVCSPAPPVRSPTKAFAILNESVTAVTSSRFSPVISTHDISHKLAFDSLHHKHNLTAHSSRKHDHAKCVNIYTWGKSKILSARCNIWPNAGIHQLDPL